MFLSWLEPSQVLALLISVLGLVTELEAHWCSPRIPLPAVTHKVKRFIQPTRAQMDLLFSGL